MSRQISEIESHYGRGGLMGRIRTALKLDGQSSRQLSPERLAPIDHLHSGGLSWTRRQAAELGLTAQTRVLDLGCGIGGPARYLARTYGCSVVGVDLTAEYVSVARELTQACGQPDVVRFLQADALDLPFEDGAFDAVFCQNLSMNVEDKAALFASVRRVLRRGGRFSTSDHTQGPTGVPYYPVGWASNQAMSFLLTPDDMRSLLEQSGFLIRGWVDGSDEILAQTGRRPTQHGERPKPGSGLEVVMGEDYPKRQANLRRNLAERRLIYITALAVRK